MATPSSASIDSIHRAYVAYYGRPADYAGLMYWANVLDQNGGNLDAVIQSFGNSAESTALYGGNSTVERIDRSEEHTSELQSREKLVCRLLLEKKKQLRLADRPLRPR